MSNAHKTATAASARFSIIEYDDHYWAVQDRETGQYALANMRESAVLIVTDLSIDPRNTRCWCWTSDPPTKRPSAAAAIKDMFHVLLPPPT